MFHGGLVTCMRAVSAGRGLGTATNTARAAQLYSIHSTHEKIMGAPCSGLLLPSWSNTKGRTQKMLCRRSAAVSAAGARAVWPLALTLRMANACGRPPLRRGPGGRQDTPRPAAADPPYCAPRGAQDSRGRGGRGGGTGSDDEGVRERARGGAPWAVHADCTHVACHAVGSTSLNCLPGLRLGQASTGHTYITLRGT